MENTREFFSTFNVLRNLHNSIVITTDMKGDIIYWSQGATEFLGYTAQEIIGKNLAALYPDISKEQLITHLHNFSNFQTSPGKWRARKKDGSYIWIEGEMTVYKNPEEKVSGFISILHDITDTVYKEQELQIYKKRFEVVQKACSEAQEDRKRLQNLLAKVPGVVWEAWGKPDHPFQKIHFVSKHVESMLGYTIDEWLHTPNFWLQIVHPEDKKRAAEESATIFTHGQGGTSRFRWLKKNGEFLWVESHSYVMKDTKGNPIGMRGVNMDISEIMEIERRKDEFIGMASHELKTPITSVKVFLHVLHKMYHATGEKKAQKYLQRMDQQMNRLHVLVSDLLDVSKIQTGKLELRKEKFSLQELIKETVENIQATTTKHRLTVQGIVKKKIYADQDRIRQVIINLLNNAIKYSPYQDNILLTIQPNDEHVLISVKDHGVGISKKHQARIFERFYRVYDRTDRTFPGLGMGLYIAFEIIKRHKGNIWVKSSKGKGSTFYICLPYQEKKVKISD